MMKQFSLKPILCEMKFEAKSANIMHSDTLGKNIILKKIIISRTSS